MTCKVNDSHGPRLPRKPALHISKTSYTIISSSKGREGEYPSYCVLGPASEAGADHRFWWAGVSLPFLGGGGRTAALPPLPRLVCLPTLSVCEPVLPFVCVPSPSISPGCFCAEAADYTHIGSSRSGAGKINMPAEAGSLHSAD